MNFLPVQAPVDYALFVEGVPVGVVEAKKSDVGENITMVEEQSARYADSTFKWIRQKYRIRFAYEATDKLVRFTDCDDIKYRSRTVFSFHRPETLKSLLAQNDTVRNHMKHFPELDAAGFRQCQINAIHNLDISFAENRPKALIQMATGAGKTFTAITAAYRLLKYGKMNRILFLVDTKSLGEQAEREFMAYMPNDDMRNFSQLYSYRVDYVLTNPPFGKKSSITFTNEENEQEEEDLVYNRQDFWTTSSNKQLNFVQHINTILKVTGKAAVVVPDNVLFEGGAGEIVRKKLLETTDLHTILRLPTGIFYKPGVKANVLFFDKRPASPDIQTREVWIYDLRTNMHFTLKQHPMTDIDLQDFIACYNPKNRYQRIETWSEENPEGRWRKYSVKEIFERDKSSLDIFWLKDKSLADLDRLPTPDEMAADIIENLQSALECFRELQVCLKK